MTTVRSPLSRAVLSMVVPCALIWTLAASAARAACAVGAYVSDDSRIVVLTNPGPDDTAPANRYTLVDGRLGGLGEDGLVACRDGRPVLKDGPEAQLRPLPLKLTPTRFQSGGVTLVGLLIEPAQRTARTPLAVLVHGGETTRAIHGTHYPYILAAQGVAAFVYDKRGTGGSGGTYTQNFDQLGQDAAAAMQEARRLAHGRYRRVGFFGGSQGGWVAPNAAARVGADFMAIGFGLALTPLEEDAEQVALEMRTAGYGESAVAEAHMVTDAVDEVVASHFTSGFARLAAARAQFGDRPWFGKIEGEFTGDVLKMSEAELKKDGPAKIDNLQIIWRYDQMKMLRSMRMPQLWLIGGDDSQAPNRLTLRRLAQLKSEGLPIQVVVFPGADHGMYEFRTLPDGTRQHTRITDGYMRLLADWIKGTVNPPYARAVFQ